MDNGRSSNTEPEGRRCPVRWACWLGAGGAALPFLVRLLIIHGREENLLGYVVVWLWYVLALPTAKIATLFGSRFEIWQVERLGVGALFGMMLVNCFIGGTLGLLIGSFISLGGSGKRK